MLIVITIPAFNEDNTLGKVIDDIKEALKLDRSNTRYQILVIDDGSTDNTVEVAEKHGAVVFSHMRNYGLAEAFRTELQKCIEMNADIIVHMDADGQYRAADIPKLIKEVENGFDLVLGNRFAGGIQHMPFIKKWGNMAFSRVISRIIHLKINDCQTGFRAFTREVAETIRIGSSHSYTQEQIIRAVKQKFKIKEVPIVFLKRKDKSRLISNSFEYALKAWINILRTYRDYEPLKFFGKIGLFLLIIGSLFGGFLLYRFLAFGTVGHIPLTIFSLLLISVGFQIVLFGFLADMNVK